MPGLQDCHPQSVFEAGGAGGNSGDESVQSRTLVLLKFLVRLPSVIPNRDVEGAWEDGSKVMNHKTHARRLLRVPYNPPIPLQR